MRGDIPCPICSSHADTNSHLGFFPSLRETLNTILQSLRVSLRDKIITSASNKITTYFLDQELLDHSIFTPIRDDSHDIYLLIHSFIPQSLVDKVHYYTNKFQVTRSIIFEFMDSFFMDIYTKVWLVYKRLGRFPKVSREGRKSVIHNGLANILVLQNVHTHGSLILDRTIWWKKLWIGTINIVTMTQSGFDIYNVRNNKISTHPVGYCGLCPIFYIQVDGRLIVLSILITLDHSRFISYFSCFNSF